MYTHLWLKSKIIGSQLEPEIHRMVLGIPRVGQTHVTCVRRTLNWSERLSNARGLNSPGTWLERPVRLSQRNPSGYHVKDAWRMSGKRLKNPPFVTSVERSEECPSGFKRPCASRKPSHIRRKSWRGKAGSRTWGLAAYQVLKSNQTVLRSETHWWITGRRGNG